MKRALLLFLGISLFSMLDAQPLTGIKTIPGDYVSLTVAVDSLNAKGVGVGGVTFQVAAGQVFNLTANPFGLKITATGTAANPIVFEKTGVGANPQLRVTGGTGTTDAGIWLNGSDYITFDGIDIVDMGTSTANYLEYGYYLNGTATNGSMNNTIKNLTIRMAGNSTTAHGIYSLSLATASGGKNSYNTIQNVIIKRSIRGIWFAGLVGFEDVGNKIQEVTIDSCGVAGNAAYGINMLYQDSALVTGSVLSNFIGNTMYVLQMNYSGNFTILGDTLRNLENGSTGTVYGIYFPSSFGNNLVKGNVVHSVTSAGGGINPIFRQIGSSINHITENTIYNITGSFTGGQIFGIIARDGTCTDYIYRNRVYNLTSAGNLGAIGTLYTSAATNTEYIYNNFVYDLKGPSTTSTYMIAGYYFIGGAVKFYYNTAYLNYTSTSATNTSAALYVNPANGTTLDSRNNLLVNSTNVVTGTRAAAFWWAGTALTNLALTCNNNLLYAGVPGAKNQIFYNGTTAYQTLANYKTAVTPREVASVTEMPPFISAVLPYDVHINPGVTTQAESGGQQITVPVINNDFDGDIRWGNPGYIGLGTAPDIGADEFSILVTDAGVSGLTSPLDTLCHGTAPVVVTLKNYGPFPLTSAKINWKVNNHMQIQYAWSGNLAVNATVGVILGSYPFHQDTTYVIQAWSSLPNFSADTAAWNDTVIKVGIHVLAPPRLDLTTSLFNICQGDSAHITGTLTGTPPWTVVLGSGTTQQTYTNLTSPVFDLAILPASTTTYTVVSVSDGGNCPNMVPAQFQVITNPAPPASITPSGTSACCSGDSVVLMGSIGLNFSYQWIKDGINIPNSANFIYAAKVGGAYTVKVTSPIGCSSTSAPVTVIVHPAPPVFLGNDTSVAAGAKITLNAGAGFNSYLWSTGQIIPTIMVDSSGTGLGTKTVWVRVTDNFACPGTDTIHISFVNNPGIAEMYAGNLFRVFPNPTKGIIELHNPTPIVTDLLIELFSLDGRSMARIRWVADPDQKNATIDLTHLSNGTYLLSITDGNGSHFKRIVVKQ